MLIYFFPQSKQQKIIRKQAFNISSVWKRTFFKSFDSVRASSQKKTCASFFFKENSPIYANAFDCSLTATNLLSCLFLMCQWSRLTLVALTASAEYWLFATCSCDVLHLARSVRFVWSVCCWSLRMNDTVVAELTILPITRSSAAVWFGLDEALLNNKVNKCRAEVARQQYFAAN